MLVQLAKKGAEIERLRGELQGLKDQTQAQVLEADISAWQEDAISRGAGTPDFWDEYSTSEMLAEWLWRLGWRNVNT